MQITTIDEARSLIGRTFEQNGEQRELRSVSHDAEWITYDDGDEELKFSRFDKYSRWLSGATEVTE